MNLDDFIKSLESAWPPAVLEDFLASLWWDKKGEWDRAYAIVQSIPFVQGRAVHTYPHRPEEMLRSQE